MSKEIVIEAKNLTKRYGSLIAVNNLDIQIEKGEIFGLLGPNGAGKTTTMLMLMGLTEPSSGTIRVLGFDPSREPVKVKSITGYMPERIGFYNDLTAVENLEYTGRLNRLTNAQINQKIDDVLNLVGLSDSRNAVVGKFSHGMKQRLGIADVMIKNPQIAIFDEPTSGIDPEGTDQILSMLKEMAQQNMTILLSSHQLNQVQKICSQVGIFAKGKIVARGTIDELGRDALRKGNYRIVVPFSELTTELRDNICNISGAMKIICQGDATIVTANNDISKEIEMVVFEKTGLKVQMRVEKFELEEVYMQYFKGS